MAQLRRCSHAGESPAEPVRMTFSAPTRWGRPSSRSFLVPDRVFRGNRTAPVRHHFRDNQNPREAVRDVRQCVSKGARSFTQCAELR